MSTRLKFLPATLNDREERTTGKDNFYSAIATVSCFLFTFTVHISFKLTQSRNKDSSTKAVRLVKITHTCQNNQTFKWSLPDFLFYLKRVQN